METTVYVPDMECDSCAKLISRKLKNMEALKNYEFGPDYVKLVHERDVNPDKFVKLIRSLGFRASRDPFERKTLKERVRHFKEKQEHYVLELKALEYFIYSFLLLSGLEILGYLALIHKTNPNFFADYGVWLVYFNLSIAANAAAVWHITAHKAKVTCMTGMMIGMTSGMQTGMMVGAVFGATNGFFVGSMVGMLLGSAVGAWMGKCCGIMGVMEGLMAGIMGGTMGPMITVMMMSDHVLVFMPFFIILNLAVIGGLVYMMLEEVGEGPGVEKRPADLAIFLSSVVLVSSVLILIMVYGPKSALLSF
ncbi:hypothetical protein D6764_03050 [Candidatus Woesearchaeota archaeon]|nr:MAG: hypothetical protein D6764_03050 [Candidatus Woesearchaeota archaeon]